MADFANSKTNEITINTRWLSRYAKSHKKASGAVKELKKFIQKQWKTTDKVHVSEDLNNKIFSKGNFSTIGRIRIRVERGPCLVNPENRVVRLSLVDVSTFKNLKDAVINE